MSEHVHIHAPHELSEASEATTARERILEIVGVVLLAAAALGTAWSGYQAARWSGVEAHDYAHADATHSRATRAVSQAGQDRLEDVSDFERWMDLHSQGNQQLADAHVQEFRPELRRAFDAWLALDPANNPAAPPTPLKMPQYHPSAAARAVSLEREGDHLLEAGSSAREDADKYVLTTVFFASVLFFAGISLRLSSEALRVTLLGLGVVFLGYAVVQLVTLPIRW